MYHRARVGGNAGPYTQGHDYLEEQVRPKFSAFNDTFIVVLRSLLTSKTSFHGLSRCNK
jgi:hypothetical protein